MTAGAPSRRAARATPWAWLPGRVGDDAAASARLGQRGDRDVGAADLERPDRLERLGLEEPPVGRPVRTRPAASGWRPRAGSSAAARIAARSTSPVERLSRSASVNAALGRRGLAVDAVRRPGERLQPVRGDRPAAARARARMSHPQPRERGLDLGQVLDRPLAKGQVALLLEDLAGGGGLGAVGHLVGCLDGLADLLEQPGPLRLELRPVRFGSGRAHRLTVRAIGRVHEASGPGLSTTCHQPSGRYTRPDRIDTVSP